MTRPALPPALVRAALAGHSALALTVCVALYLISLTGTLAMLRPELDRFQYRNAPAVRATPELAAAALAALPSPETYRRVTLEFPEAGRDLLFVRARPERGAESLFAADTRGQLSRLPASRAEIIAGLHERLLLPGLIGLTLVGLLGVAMLALIGSGLLAHARLFRDAFAWRGGADRVGLADRHNRLSVWALPFHLGIALTGAALGLSLPIATLLAKATHDAGPAQVATALLGPQGGAGDTRADLPDVAAILRLASPGATVQRVLIDRPGTATQQVRIDLAGGDRLIYGDRRFYTGDGRELVPGGLVARDPANGVLSALFAIHFGSFGGAPLRYLYFALGIMLCVVIDTGVRIWLLRRAARPYTATLSAMWKASVLALPAGLGLILLM